MSFRLFQFFLSGRGLVLFFLGRSEKTPPQSFLKLSEIFTRRALLSPHREPGSFSEATQTCVARAPSPACRHQLRAKPFSPPPASSRCATADYDLSLLRSPSPASWSAAGTSPASHPREAHP